MPVCVDSPMVGTDYIDTYTVKRTVKLLCRGQAAVTDVLMLVQSLGIRPEQVAGVCRGPPGGPAYYVTFTDEDPVEVMKRQKELSYRKLSFVMVALGSQVVSLRVHWLPLIFGDNVIKSMLASYGKVLSVRRAESRGFQNGTREVQLEVSEEERLALPHLVRLRCGTPMLLTMQGRPPLCLLCRGLGHVRRDCPRSHTYANFSASDARRQEPPKLPQTQQQQMPQPQRPLEKENAEENVSQGQQPPITEPSQPVEEQQLPLDDSAGELVIDLNALSAPTEKKDGKDDDDDDDSDVMEVVTHSLKRNLGEVATDSFTEEFPPQKVVRSATLETHNRYQALGDLESLLEEDED